MKLNEKQIAIITGGNRGIGLAITRKLKQMGFITAVIHKHDDSPVAASGVSEDSRLIDFEFIGDVSIQGSVEQFYQNLIEKYPSEDYNLTLLVNNAGVASAKKFLDLSADDFREMMDTNLIGAFYMSKLFAQHCVKGSSNEIQSQIINISSVSGLQGFSGHAHYCASKFALAGMAQVMAKELSKIGIAVNNVCPGPTQTDMWSKLDREYKENGFMPEEANEDDYSKKLLVKRMGKPEDVAEAVAYLTVSEYTTGINLPICGGNILR